MKKGISLIVLVITILVMIIIAGAIIISLTNTDLITRSNEAVESSNAAELRSAVALAYSNAYAAHIKGVQDGTVAAGTDFEAKAAVLADSTVVTLLQKVNNNKSGNVYTIETKGDAEVVYVLVMNGSTTVQDY